MRIGIDFDNTIACYDHVFSKVALEKGIAGIRETMNKTEVRNCLREATQEDLWTSLQGEVYGAKMHMVSPYPYFSEFLKKVRSLGCEVFIVSHKTKYPYLGTSYDLHKSALEWLLQENIVGESPPALRSDHVFFELTKQKKIQRIRELFCDIFIDDLPEFLEEKSFPSSTRKYLFNPNRMSLDFQGEQVYSWKEMKDKFKKLANVAGSKYDK